nr:unnamed protein product [Callosobruchus analis]
MIAMNTLRQRLTTVLAMNLELQIQRKKHHLK